MIAHKNSLIMEFFSKRKKKNQSRPRNVHYTIHSPSLPLCRTPTFSTSRNNL